MHNAIVISKIDKAEEIFDLAKDGLRYDPDCKPLRLLYDRIHSLCNVLGKYKGKEEEMVESQEVNKAFRGVFDLKDKFDEWVYDSFRTNKNWYIAANVMTDAKKDLDEQLLAEHVVRECLKKGMKPWEAVCATNSVMEKDLVKIGDTQRLYMSMQLSGKIK